MTLLTTRTKFIQLSGRLDLVVDTTGYADNGADFHINAGQKWLDKLADVPENTAQIFQSLAAGEYALTFQKHCRSVETVFVNSSSDRFELERIKLSDLKNYYNETAADTTNEEPAYYALANLRALETTAKESLGTFINNTFDEDDTNYNYRGIIVVPPVDETYTVEITGKFLQNILTADADENFWTVEYPHILVMAALRSLEVFNRNTEGVKDWESAIRNEMFDIDLDVAHEESFNVTQMDG